jgi:hypothetical protein
MNPARKLMLVVRKLHLMGYEGLRLAPYLAPSGMYWRAQIVPVKYISPQHGAISIERSRYSGIPTYTSGNGDDYFELGTVESDTPQQIAEKFIDRFQELRCKRSHSTDQVRSRIYNTKILIYSNRWLNGQWLSVIITACYT